MNNCDKATFLFSFIQEAKDVGCYKISNLAFSCLLDLALKTEWLKLIWESRDNSAEDEWDYVVNRSYYDLIVISDGLRDTCIPVPIVRDEYQKNIFLDAQEKDNFWEARNHNRSLGKCLPRQKDYLETKLVKAFPNCYELAETYLDITQSQDY